MIRVERWSIYSGVFRDERLNRAVNDNSEMSWPIIGAVKPVIAWRIGREDPLGLCRMMAQMRNDELDFLVLQAIFEVDQLETF